MRITAGQPISQYRGLLQPGFYQAIHIVIVLGTFTDGINVLIRGFEMIIDNNASTARQATIPCQF